MFRRLGRLPLTVRIPLGVAVLSLLVSSALITLSLHGLSRQFERQIADLGQVYLDGLSAAVLPAVRAGDQAQMLEVLNRALDTQVGIIDRTLAIIDAQGKLVAHVARYDEVEAIPLKARLARSTSGTYLSTVSNGVWTWRLLDENQPALGTVAANLDAGDFIEQRRSLAIELVLAGLGVSLAGAGLGFLLARRLQRPIMRLTQQLRAARRHEPELLDLAAAGPGDSELKELMDAYNWMVRSVQERETLARRHDRIERAALLGRMSAALAHEVRNPLAGMQTALQTLRRFGHQEEARRDAIDFVDRGVQTLRAVVDASLQTFRPDERAPRLTLADIQDVQVLIRSEARRKRIRLTFRNDWPEQELPLPAAPLRQILLNLLLNAVAASPPGAEIAVDSECGESRLLLRVADQGPGFPEQARAALLRPGDEHAEGMGLGIVRELVEGLAGEITVAEGSRQENAGRGAVVTVLLPYAPQEDRK